MKCPICGAETSGLLWFDGSRAFFQCRKNSNHILLHAETLETLSAKTVIVTDREKRIREANISMVFVDPEEAEIIAAMGSRVASLAVMRIMRNITKEKVATLSNKYTTSIGIILSEVEHRIKYRKRNFKRRII